VRSRRKKEKKFMRSSLSIDRIVKVIDRVTFVFSIADSVESCLENVLIYGTSYRNNFNVLLPRTGVEALSARLTYA